MSTRSAPIVTATERLMTDIEAAVATLPRKHRYALGTDLRTWSRESVMCSHHAWRAVRSPDRQAQMLRQRLKPEQHLKPLTDGIEFIGYIVHPTHTRVRRRVVAHCNDALSRWERAHVTAGGRISATPEQRQHITSVWASYQGHMQHANSHRLRARIAARYAWLGTIGRG